MANRNPYLLPQNVEPTHYFIQLKPNLGEFTFIGEEKIVINIKKPTSKIVLNAIELEIKEADICYIGQVGHAPAQKIIFNKKMETVTFNFGQTLPIGQANLHINFTGKLNDKMHGFYRTSYEVGGQKRWGAATQFEATDARRALPCWDEPDRKAKFNVTLIVPEKMTALSNMPVKKEKILDGGLKEVVYRQTPPMSTYLLAFVVADLEYIEARDRNGIPIRVWTTLGKKEQGRFALEKTLHTLPYFTKWFGIPYALPKLDMVALPDFAAGAMENWGLITYRETALLIDRENSSAAAKQQVSEVVDHELAHQWFGNYTTMKWWTDLWLNEGFASYMGPKATYHQFPEWETWTQYVADEYLSALHEDGLKNTHPVEIEVRNPSDIGEIFDAISYSKGSVINRMNEHYLGEENLRKGLQLYLKRHKYANATTKNLWRALQEASGKPVRAIMASYTRQEGYPVLVVSSKEQKHKLVLHLRQKRFLFDGSKDSKNALWKIPIGFITSKTFVPAFKYMSGRTAKLNVNVQGNEWVKLNPNQSGFYRVAYPKALWQKLAVAVENKILPTVDRLGLLDDAFALARAGYMKTSMALDILKAYKLETDFSVWLVIGGGLDILNNLISGEGFKSRFNEFAKEFFRPIAELKGWKKSSSDGHIDILLRSLALRNLGGYGDASTIEEARDLFKQFINCKELDPNLRQVVYILVAENSGEKEFEELLKIYSSTDLQEEKMRVIKALGNCRSRELIERFLEFSLSDKVRSQDAPFVIMSAASHSLGRALAWEFVKINWEVLLNRYHESGIGLFSRMLSITSGFTTKGDLDDISEFFKAHKVTSAKRTMKQVIEIVKSNIAWIERDRNDIQSFFN